VEEDNIQNVMPQLVEKFKNQGELFDKDFDEENIRNTTIKDHLVTNRRRSINLTSKSYLLRQYEKKYASLKNKVEKAKRAYKRKKPLISSTHGDEIDDELVLKIPRHSGTSSSSLNL
jgi:hypothetical protein